MLLKQVDLVHVGEENHNGNDYAGPGVDHEPVSVIQQGKVGYAGYLGSAGNAVVIDHPDGSTSKYFHLADNSIKVSKGQDIVPGQVIGTVGSTGRSTGTHLHFEIWRNGQPIDPSAEADNYFRFGGNVKVTPKASVAPGAGAPTAVLMAGTNDYGSPAAGAAGVKEAIRNLQQKGYNVVVVPPSEVGQTSEVSKQVQEVAKQMGATVRKGQYMQNDGSGAIPYAHLTKDSADAIARDYKGATFVGDSNAQKIPGAKIAAVSQSSSTIAGMINQQISSVAPTVQPATPQPQPRVQVDQSAQSLRSSERIESYPSYNTASTRVILMPITSQPGQQAPVMMSAGGQTSTIPSTGQSKGQVLNSVVKSVLFTSLMAT